MYSSLTSSLIKGQTGSFLSFNSVNFSDYTGTAIHVGSYSNAKLNKTIISGKFN